MTAAIFRMEHAHDTDEVKRAIRYVGQTVDQSPFKQAIDKAVMQWLHYRMDSTLSDLKLPDVDDILKGTEMIETNMERIRAKAVAEAMAEGLAEGKGEHSFKLLTLIDPGKVMDASPWAKRFVEAIREKMGV